MPGDHAFLQLRDGEFRATAGLLAVVLVIGLATAPDYGITTDEFIFDGYGPRALAWYTSAFTDRSQFSFFDVYLYGPWFQILVGIVQSFGSPSAPGPALPPSCSASPPATFTATCSSRRTTLPSCPQ
jgi:hypothetical protein